MSTIFCQKNAVFVDHVQYLQELYSYTINSNNHKVVSAFAFTPKPFYFAVLSPHIPSNNNTICKVTNHCNVLDQCTTNSSSVILKSSNKKRKRRKRKLPYNDGEIEMIKYHESIRDHLIKATTEIVSSFKASYRTLETVKPEVKVEHFPCLFYQTWNESCKQLDVASNLDCITSKDAFFSFENQCNFSHLIKIKEVSYLIPMHSKCICSDISNMSLLVNDCKVNGLYNCVVLDPPWENKSVKRGRKYNTLDFHEIAKIPLNKLCDKNCLIIVWVTNKQKIKNWVKETFFKKWNISFLFEWHWVKLTASGEPVFPWDSLHKKPYETLVIGCYQSSSCDNFDSSAVTDLVIGSMPTAVHSHKPPLNEIIKTCLLKPLGKDTRCLEMFARSLTSGWTSWGNEVLMLQNIEYFDKV